MFKPRERKNIHLSAAGAGGFYAYRQNEMARRSRLTAVAHGRKVNRMGQGSSAKPRAADRKIAGPGTPWSNPVGEDSRNRSRFMQASTGSFLSSPSLPRVKRLHNDSLDMSSSGRMLMTAHRHYPTHQPQFGGVGILPSVHLQPTSRAILSEHNSSMVHKPVTVKIAPPSDNSSFLLSPRVTRLDDSMMVSSSFDPCDTETVVTALREKRKRAMRDDEAVPSTSGQVNKRRKHGEDQNGDQPIVPNGGVDMDMTEVRTGNLKRPALPRSRRNSTSTELEASPKRLKHETSRPGSSKRNAIEMSFSSSRRWLEKQTQVTTPEVPARQTRSRSRSREPSRSRETSGVRQPQVSQQESGQKKRSLPRLAVDEDVVMEEHAVGEQSVETDEPGTPLLEQNGTEDELEVTKETPKKKLFPLAKESSARRRQTPIYSALSNSFNKVPQLQQSLTVEDYEKDRQANLERVQTMLQEVEEAHRQKTEKSEETAPVPSTSATSDKPLGIVGPSTSNVTSTSAATATTTTASTSGIKINLTSSSSSLQTQPTTGAVTALNQSSVKGQNATSQSETATSSVKSQSSGGTGGFTFAGAGQSSSVGSEKSAAGGMSAIAGLLSPQHTSKTSAVTATPPASSGLNFNFTQTPTSSQPTSNMSSSVTDGGPAPPPYPSSTSGAAQKQYSFSPVFGGNTAATATSTSAEPKNPSTGISTSGGFTGPLSTNLSPITSPVSDTSTQPSVRFGIPESISAAQNLATLTSPAVTNTLLNTNKFGVQVSGQTTPQPGGHVGGFSFGNTTTSTSTATKTNVSASFSFGQSSTQSQQPGGQSSSAMANPLMSSGFANASQTSAANSSFGKEKTVASSSNFNFGSNPSTGSTSSTTGFQFSAGSTAQNTSTFGQNGTTSTSIFGQTALPTASIFGQSTAPAPASTSGMAFGQNPSNTAASSIFGQSSGLGATAFGQPASSTSTTTTASIFGKNTASGPGPFQFGGTDTGRTTPSGGSQAVQFGSVASTSSTPSFNFGAQSSTSTQNVFGAGSSTSSSVFGNTNTNNPPAFGAASTNTGNPPAFGSKLPQPFGNTGVFGSQNASPAFGQNTQDTGSSLNKALLSTPPNKNPFGSNPSQTTFGAPVKQNPKDQSQANKGFDFTSSTNSSGSAFTFGGSSNSAGQQQASSAFVFGQSNQGQNNAGSFNFSAGSTPTFGNPAPSGPPPQFGAPQAASTPGVFGQQQQGPGGGMFSIGSGSTAPRMRNNTRARRRPPKR